MGAPPSPCVTAIACRWILISSVPSRCIGRSWRWHCPGWPQQWCCRSSPKHSRCDPEISNDGVAQVASPLDLLATKLKVLLQRAERKDDLDVATLLEAGLSLADGLAAANALYGSSFPPEEALKALVTFADGDLP